MDDAKPAVAAHPAAASILAPGSNCWRIARADRAAVIIDAADYFATVRRAMLNAKHRILLIGWDFDTRIRLDRGRAGPRGVPTKLGDFVLWLADNRPDLQINILKWNLGALKMLGRGSTLITAARWAMHDRISFKLDGAHPTGASHHQKVVVIDDALAVCGGIDMTADRWDTREHLDDDRRRRRPNGERYGAWHDVTMVVDGAAAVALGELGRARWALASGETLPPPPPGSDPWPECLVPTFRDVDLGIARTRAGHGECEEIREVERLYLDLIGSAKRFIYCENQYFASRKVGEAIAKRLAEPDPPEIVLVMPVTADGWLEQQAMDGARARLVESIRLVDHRRRFRIYHPTTAGGQPIYVHAKLMIVDDRVLRIGSANMNNRSLGIDSECDLVLDAGADPGLSPVIEQLRVSLLAEHLGVAPATVTGALVRSGSMIATVEQLRGTGRSLAPYRADDLGAVATFVADNEILDPEAADAVFEPIAKRGLFRRRVLPAPAPSAG